MAGEAKIDPMHQFLITPVGGGELTGSPFVFTNSALWMLVVLGCILLFKYALSLPIPLAPWLLGI